MNRNALYSLLSILILTLTVFITSDGEETAQSTSTLAPISIVEYTDALGSRKLTCYSEDSIIGELLKSSKTFALYHQLKVRFC